MQTYWLILYFQVHFLYQYSLQLFLEIFHSVLQSNKLNGVKEYAARLSIITNELFQVSLSYDWVSYFDFAIDKQSRYIPLYNWNILYR